MPNEIHNIEVAEQLLERAISSMMQKLETFDYSVTPVDALMKNEKFEQAYAIMENYELLHQLIRFMENQWQELQSSQPTQEVKVQIEAQQQKFRRTINIMYNWVNYKPNQTNESASPRFKTDALFYKKLLEVHNCLVEKGNDGNLTDDHLKKIALAVRYARDKLQTSFGEDARIHNLFKEFYDALNNPSIKSRLEKLGFSVQTPLVEVSSSGRKPTLQVQRKDTQINSLADLLLLVDQKVDLMGRETPVHQELHALVISLREAEADLLKRSPRVGNIAETASISQRITENDHGNLPSSPQIKNSGATTHQLSITPKKPGIQEALQLSHSVSVSSLTATQNKSTVDHLTRSLHTTVSTTVRDEEIIEQISRLGEEIDSSDLTLIDRIILLDKLLKESRYSQEVFKVYEKVNNYLIQELTNQIIDMDRQLFKDVDMDRFLKLDTTEPNMAALIANFNKLSHLVTYCILIPNINLRILMMQRMINMARILDEKGDYNATMAILGALGNSSLGRLTNTFEGLPSAAKAILTKLQNKYSFDNSSNKLRMAHEDPTKLIVPYTAMYKGDLTFLADGNKNKHLFDMDVGIKTVSIIMNLHKNLTQSNSPKLSARHDFQDYFNAYEDQNSEEFDKMTYEISQKHEKKGTKIKSNIADLYDEMLPGGEVKKTKKAEAGGPASTVAGGQQSQQQDKLPLKGVASVAEKKVAPVSKQDKSKIVATNIELINTFDKLLEELRVLYHPDLTSWGNTVASDSFGKIREYNQPESFIEVTEDEWRELQDKLPHLKDRSLDKITINELSDLNHKFKLSEKIEKGQLEYKIYTGKLAGGDSEPADAFKLSVAEKAQKYVYKDENGAETDAPFTALYSIRNGKLVKRRVTTEHRSADVAQLLNQLSQHQDISLINNVTKTLSEIDNYINILMRQVLANKTLNLDVIPAFNHIINQKYDRLTALLNKNQNAHNTVIRDALIAERQKFNLFAKSIEATISKHNREIKMAELQRHDFTDDLAQMNILLDELNQDPAIRNIFDQDYDPTKPSLVEHLKPEAIELLKVEDSGFAQLANDHPERAKKIEQRALLLAQQRALKREFKDIMIGAYGIVLIDHGGQRGHHRDQAANAAVEAYQKDQNANTALKKLIKAFADVYAAISMVKALQEQIRLLPANSADDIERLEEKLNSAIRKLDEVEKAKQDFQKEMAQYNKHEYQPLIAQAEQFRRIQYAHKSFAQQPGYREPTEEELQNISIYIDANSLTEKGRHNERLAPYSTSLGSVYNSLSKPMWMVMNGGQNLHVPGEENQRMDPVANKKFNAAIRDNDPHHLSPAAKSYAGNVTRAITVKLDACSGWGSPVIPYDKGKEPTVLMLARGAPQLDDPALEEYKKCIIDAKSYQSRIELDSLGDQSGLNKRYLLLKNKEGHFIGKNKNGQFVSYSKKDANGNVIEPPIEERLYLDAEQYLDMKRQEIREKLNILKAAHDKDNNDRPVYFKTPVIGVGAFAWLNGKADNDIGKMLEPLFFQAYHDVIVDDEDKHEYTHENMVIEIVAYRPKHETHNTQREAFKNVFGYKMDAEGAVAEMSGVSVRILDSDKNTLGISPTDYRHIKNPERYILAGDPGADNGSVFGNELQYASLEAEVGNNAASSRGVGSPLVNPHMLDPRHQFIFDKNKRQYVTVAAHLGLSDEQIEASKPAEVLDLEFWNKNRRVLVDLLLQGNAEEIKAMISASHLSTKGREEIVKALHNMVIKNEFDGKNFIDKAFSKQVLHFTQDNKQLTASQYHHLNALQEIAANMNIILEGIEKINVPSNYNVHRFFESTAEILIHLIGKREKREAGDDEILDFESSIKGMLSSHKPPLSSTEKLEILEAIFEVIRKNQSLELDESGHPIPLYPYINKGGAIFKAKQEATGNPLTDTQIRHIKSLKTIYFDIVKTEYDSKMKDKKESIKVCTAALASMQNAIDKEDGLVDFQNSHLPLSRITGTRKKIEDLKAPKSLSQVLLTPSSSRKDVRAAKTRNLIDDLKRVVEEIIAAQSAGKPEKAAVLVRAYLGKDNSFIEKLGKAVFGNTREQFVKIAADTEESEDPLTSLISQANKNLAQVIRDTGILNSSHWPNDNSAKTRIAHQLTTKIKDAPPAPPARTELPIATIEHPPSERHPASEMLNTVSSAAEYINPLHVDATEIVVQRTTEQLSELENPLHEDSSDTGISLSESSPSATENPLTVSESAAVTPHPEWTQIVEYRKSIHEHQAQRKQAEELLLITLKQEIEQIKCVVLKEFLLKRLNDEKIINLPTQKFVDAMVSILNKFHMHDIPTYSEYIHAFGTELLGEAKDLADDGKNNFNADYKENAEQFRRDFEEKYLAKLDNLRQEILTADLASKLKEVENLEAELEGIHAKLQHTYDDKKFRFFRAKLSEIEDKLAVVRKELRHYSHAVEELVAELHQDLLFNKHMSQQHRILLSDLVKIENSNEALQVHENNIERFIQLKKNIEKEQEASVLNKLSGNLRSAPKPKLDPH